jgi:hypothetical protein
MGDRYDDLKGPELAAELSERELSVTGRVDELRDRLREDDEKRAQAAADGPDGGPATSDPTEAGPEVPEPRKPLEMAVLVLSITEDQARDLTAREAGVARFLKHVAPFEARKYVAGDRLVAVTADHRTAAVLGVVGLVVRLDSDQAEG